MWIKMATVIALLACIGCGPSVQEQYATALAIRDQEKKEMSDLLEEFKQACADYAHIDRSREAVAAVTGSGMTNETRNALPIEATRILDRAASQRAADKLSTLETFVVAAMQPDSREAGRLDRWASDNHRAEVPRFREQYTRWQAAESRVAELRKESDNTGS